MRYAVYLAVKPNHALALAGASWLGRDAVSGESEMMPEIEGLDADRQILLTKSPRHYGFHGTLRAPFQLAEGVTEHDLMSAAYTFAADAPVVSLSSGLHVSEKRGFISLAQAGPDAGMNALAESAVRTFEPMRAPLTDAQIARRRLADLTPRQDELMLRWGYPYVFEQFWFHMSLTGKITDDHERSVLKRAAERHFRPALTDLNSFHHIAVFQESTHEGPFRLVAFFELTGQRSRRVVA